uniref:M-ectatotoxin-Eb2b n=1 Tax=Ectatomma brunneum TaxID=369127 RepID=LTX2B_ECTBR|nr:RecName: Full=M-ectatotoxin-Eb2b; Short=M-ECTX-Eb2b; AltName: Full=Ponericin-Q49 [Ectatomma brunneum]
FWGALVAGLAPKVAIGIKAINKKG